jgi:hypothetical protein
LASGRRRTPDASPAEATLVCPSCGDGYAANARFCETCRIPLVFGGAELVEPVSKRHEQARKIKPQLAEGALVKVAYARNLAEAELVQSLLLEEGVPSVLRRSAGFDVPDFLAAGPRDVLVAESGVLTAREVLLEAELIPEGGAPARTESPARLLAWLIGALAVGLLVVWALLLLTR